LVLISNKGDKAIRFLSSKCDIWVLQIECLIKYDLCHGAIEDRYV
jgi:hypothetical protein